MKRKFLLALTAILILVCATGILVACNRTPDTQAKDNVSRRTDAYFAGESETFAVSIEKGRREKVFIADGKATDVVDFCQITVTPLSANKYDGIKYTVKGETETLEGELTSSDYGEYSATVELNFVPKSVTLTAGSDTDDVELADILQDKLTSADAINIAKDGFKDKIEKEASDGKAEREIYVKLITGDRESYFYYVSFIGDGVDYWAMLIDPKTGDIVSKR